MPNSWMFCALIPSRMLYPAESYHVAPAILSRPATCSSRPGGRRRMRGASGPFGADAGGAADGRAILLTTGATRPGEGVRAPFRHTRSTGLASPATSARPLTRPPGGLASAAPLAPRAEQSRQPLAQPPRQTRGGCLTRVNPGSGGRVGPRLLAYAAWSAQTAATRGQRGPLVRRVREAL
jgi:hypothetical protein